MALDMTNILVLDTETTGLGDDAEIIEIAIINGSGETVMNTLVKSTVSIPADATAIHGITDDDLLNAPDFADIVDEIKNVIQGKLLLIYNADYDLRLLRQSARKSRVRLKLEPASVRCVMLEYAEFFGDWDDSHQGWKWQKLVNAARHTGYEPAQGMQLHRAIADCIATLHVYRHMQEE
jgi:DNA polymerase-3 subunit epsilon